MDEEKAKPLIDEGFVKQAEQPGEDSSDLPVDLPSRAALIKEGLLTVEQVLASKEVLTDIKGIGEKTAVEIIEILSK
uniref:Hef nuclease n=2 Tax=root TaxID=1 RepID=A0A8S5U9A2_9CAUD|nr:MAG TPA: Hef nuclease [Siphoviridae sp. ct7aK2]